MTTTTTTTAAGEINLNIGLCDHTAHISRKTHRGIHRGFTALSDIADGADLTAKATKFVRAVILAAACCFQAISQTWTSFADKLSGFHEIIDFIMIPVAIKDIFDLASGKVKGWAKQVSTACLVAFRILTSMSFLHGLKFINLSSLMTTIGSIPVLNLLTSAFGILACAFDVVHNGRELYNRDNRIEASKKEVTALYWKYTQAKVSEKHFESRLKDAMKYVIINPRLQDLVNQTSGASRVDLEKMSKLHEGIINLFEPAGKIEVEGEGKAEVAAGGESDGKRSVAEGEAETKSPKSAADLKKEKLYANMAKAEKGLAKLIKMSEQLMQIGHFKDNPLIDVEYLKTVHHMAKILNNDNTADKIGGLFKKAMADHLSLIRPGSSKELYKFQAAEKLKSIDDHCKGYGTTQFKPCSNMSTITTIQARERAVFSTPPSRGSVPEIHPYTHSDGTKIVVVESTVYVQTYFMPKEEFCGQFAKLSRYTNDAKTALSDSNSNIRSKWMAIVDKVVKIALISLMLVGMAGVSVFAMSSPIMIALLLGSTAISLGKVIYDKLYLDQPLKQEKSKIEMEFAKQKISEIEKDLKAKKMDKSEIESKAEAEKRKIYSSFHASKSHLSDFILA